MAFHSLMGLEIIQSTSSVLDVPPITADEVVRLEYGYRDAAHVFRTDDVLEHWRKT
ncbi:hypothetical protein [Methylobacterium sp. Leaf100]|uniref:hypothetical protein n=1 Tax=Methylobacterium sp. Leaf100 TaxID=1736252 RepID=UPI000AE00D38|nr:hypothetical protein [Methylobacterium sp. Leaf100]